jgi:hypothetical protein
MKFLRSAFQVETAFGAVSAGPAGFSDKDRVVRL